MNHRERAFCTVLSCLLNRMNGKRKFTFNDILITEDDFRKEYTALSISNTYRKSYFTNYVQGKGRKSEKYKFILATSAFPFLQGYFLASPDSKACTYDIDSLLTDEVLQILHQYSRKEIYSFLKRLFAFEKNFVIERQNPIDGASPEDVAWLSVAAMTYDFYIHNKPLEVSDYAFRQKDILPICANFNPSFSKNKYSKILKPEKENLTDKKGYFAVAGKNGRRLSFIREGAKIPSFKLRTLQESIVTLDGKKTIRSLVKFIREIYNGVYYPTNAQFEKLSDEEKKYACIKVEDTFIHRNRGALLDYAVNKFCAKPTDLMDFLVHYNGLLTSSDLLTENSILISDITSFENELLSRNDILSGNENTFREFKGRGRNAKKLMEEINFMCFDGMAISAKKIFEEKQNIMQTIDIRDEYELCAYIRKFCPNTIKAYGIKFPGDPVLIVGEADEDRQMETFLDQNMPIERRQAVKEYVNLYGFTESYTVNRLRKFGKYLAGGVFRKENAEKSGEKESSSDSYRRSSYLSKIFNNEAPIQQKAPNENTIKSIKYFEEDTKEHILYNRIMREFLQCDLVCEININDEEYAMLMKHFKKFYQYLRKNKQEPVVSILMTVELIEIAIHNYRRGFWKYVQDALELDSLPLNHHDWIGGTATKTLKTYGKVYLNDREDVGNILMHAFITDPNATDFFEYLSQYYAIDLERSVSKTCEDEAGFICDCIRDPNSKRQQFLSDYAGMSVAAHKDYCQEVVADALKLIDESFWGEESSFIANLPDRLYKKFIIWKDYSKDFREQRAQLGRKGSFQRVKNFRSPHLVCNHEEGSFEIVLPRQNILMRENNASRHIYWVISREGANPVEINCSLKEGHFGFLTHEITYPIDAKDIFSAYRFELKEDNDVIRSFTWNELKLNIFDEDGDWERVENIEYGEYFGYAEKITEIDCDAITHMSTVSGLNFYEFNFQEGDILKIIDGENYYLGALPEAGLSREGKVEGVICRYKDTNVSVYASLPALIIDVPDEKFEGTAITANGEKQHFSSAEFLKISYGRRTDVKFYYLDLRKVKGIKRGYNEIQIDIANSKRDVQEKFVYIPGFSFDYEEKPYLFKTRGTLVCNYAIDKNDKNLLLVDDRTSEPQHYDFDMDDLEEDTLSYQLKTGSDILKVYFDVPVLRYSIDGTHWSFQKPQDIWHEDLSDIIYIQYPANSISLSINGQNGEENSFSFTKNGNDVFKCDLTRIKSYIHKDIYFNRIYLKAQDKKEEFIRILTRNVLNAVTMTPDYETNLIRCTFDILGKGDFCADVSFDGEMLCQKAKINNGILQAEIPIHDGIYTVAAFKDTATNDDFDDFDDVESYQQFGEKKVRVVDISHLEGNRIEIENVVSVRAEDHIYPLTDKGTLTYMILDKKLKGTEYQGRIIIGHDYKGKYQIYGLYDAVATVKSTDKTLELEILYLDDDVIDGFLYDNEQKVIVDEDNKSLTTSQRYRRYYPVFWEDEYIWHAKFVDINESFEKTAECWVRRRAEAEHRRKTKTDIWKN